MFKLKFFSICFIALFSLFSQNIYAQQNNDEGLDEVCSLSSGKWHTAASGWACCWSNWGCYGCTGGSCVMKCETTRCRKANGMSRTINQGKQQYVQLNDLAPRGKKAPIIPKPMGKRPIKENQTKRPMKESEMKTRGRTTETHETGEMEDHH